MSAPALAQLLAELAQRGLEPAEDIAWVALSAQELGQLPGDAFVCPLRGVACKRWQGVEFRTSAWVDAASPQALASYQGRIAWNLTRRTRGFFPF